MASYAFMLFTTISFMQFFLGSTLVGVGMCQIGPSLEVILSESFSILINYLTLSNYLQIGIGVMLVLLGALGIFGALKKDSFTLHAYMVINLLSLVVYIFVLLGALIIRFSEKTHIEWKKEIWERMKNNTDDFHFIYELRYECCGMDGVNDYTDNYVPPFCVNVKSGGIMAQGCADGAIEYIIKGAQVIWVTALILFATTLVMTFLAQRIRREIPYYKRKSSHDVRLISDGFVDDYESIQY